MPDSVSGVGGTNAEHSSPAALPPPSAAPQSGPTSAGEAGVLGGLSAKRSPSDSAPTLTGAARIWIPPERLQREIDAVTDLASFNKTLVRVMGQPGETRSNWLARLADRIENLPGEQRKEAFDSIFPAAETTERGAPGAPLARLAFQIDKFPGEAVREAAYDRTLSAARDAYARHDLLPENYARVLQGLAHSSPIPADAEIINLLDECEQLPPNVRALTLQMAGYRLDRLSLAAQYPLFERVFAMAHEPGVDTAVALVGLAEGAQHLHPTRTAPVTDMILSVADRLHEEERPEIVKNLSATIKYAPQGDRGRLFDAVIDRLPPRDSPHYLDTTRVLLDTFLVLPQESRATAYQKLYAATPARDAEGALDHLEYLAVHLDYLDEGIRFEWYKKMGAEVANFDSVEDKTRLGMALRVQYDSLSPAEQEIVSAWAKRQTGQG
jgi:hypothetical protein